MWSEVTAPLLASGILLRIRMVTRFGLIRSTARAGTTRGASREAKQAHGSFCSAADQRDHARLDLRADRHRLYDGVRHHWHGEFRAWRCVYGVGFHRPDHAADPHDVARDDVGRARALHRTDRRDGI